MSNKKTLEQMSTTEAKRAGITSLADRPNDKSRYGEGGLTSTMLKERFDALPNLVRDRFNSIAAMLASADAAKYITLGGEDNALGETLFDFLALFGPRGDGITDKNISDLIETLYQKEDSTVNVSTPIKDIVHDIERRIVKANAGRVTNARFDVASNSLVISFAGGNDLSVDLSAISVGEGVSGEIERLKDTDVDHERRISNLEEHISDDYFVTDYSVAYEKAVPARACSSAKLMSLGGMTYRDEETNTLRDSKVTEIKSRDTDGNVIAIRPIPTEIQAINEGKGIDYYGAYADTIDFEKKKYIERINTIELTGNEAFSAGSYYILTNNLFCPKGVDTYIIRTAEAFPVSFSNTQLNNLQFGSGTDSVFNYFADLNAFKAHLAERYASGNPVTVIYPLAEPIVTDISAELEGFDNIIEVEGGGSLEFVNEYKNPVPSTVKYLLKEESAV